MAPEAFLGRLVLSFALGVKGLGGVFNSRLRTSSRFLESDFVDTMPPQPLSNVPKSGSFHVAYTGNVLGRKKRLASYIGQVIQIGAQIEYRWAAIVVQLLNAAPKPGAAMYLALSGGKARRDALLAAAYATLKFGDAKLLESVMIASAPARKLRNDFAHNLWALCKELPKDLLLIDPAVLVEHEADIAAAANANHFPRPIDRARIWHYKLSHFEEALESVNRAAVLVRYLESGLDPEGTSLSALAHLQLSTQPEVVRAMKKLAHHRRPHNNPISRPQSPL